MQLVYGDLDNLKGKVISYVKYNRIPSEDYYFFKDDERVILKNGHIFAKIGLDSLSDKEKFFEEEGVVFNLKPMLGCSLDIKAEEDVSSLADQIRADIVFAGIMQNPSMWENKIIAAIADYFRFFYPQKNNKDEFGNFITYDKVDPILFKNYVNEHFIIPLKNQKILMTTYSICI